MRSNRPSSDNKIKEKALEKYDRYMAEVDETDYDRINVIGDEAYQVLCSTKKTTNNRKRLDELLIETGVSITEYGMIKAGSRKRNLTEYKLKYIKAALQHKYTYKEIGKNTGMTDSGVKDMFDRHESEVITG